MSNEFEKLNEFLFNDENRIMFKENHKINYNYNIDNSNKKFDKNLTQQTNKPPNLSSSKIELVSNINNFFKEI